MTTEELFVQMAELWEDFSTNHKKYAEKQNKSAAQRARKAIGGLKKLVTEYRKLSSAEVVEIKKR